MSAPYRMVDVPSTRQKRPIARRLPNGGRLYRFERSTAASTITGLAKDADKGRVGKNVVHGNGASG